MKDIINGNISDDLKDLNQYAFLSAYVYRDNTLNVSIKALKNNWKEINLKTKIKSVAWYQYKTCGLDFQIWKNEKINTIAIVFRGSEKQLGDWISNLRWFFLPRINPFIYDQYDQVRDSISDIVDELNSKYPNYKVVTAGHSLGGGLAQYAAYSGKSIKKVYAFDPSPVTGFYSVDCEIKKVSVRDLQIYRIYESGEILIIGRLFTKNPFSHESVDPEIVELRHNLLSGDMIEQHDISSFANELNKEFTKIKESDHTKEIQK